MLDQWVEEIAATMLARWVMEHREREVAAAGDSDRTPHPEERGTASDNFFPNSAPPNHASRTAT
jgi:hypothetical protein